MKEETPALLVSDQMDSFVALAPALERESIRTIRVRSCEDALQALTGANPPHLIFTDTAFCNGTCQDAVALAARACKPVSVIVASRLNDIRLYIEAMECGAFAFIVPPFKEG